jgi:hypothetical protein
MTSVEQFLQGWYEQTLYTSDENSQYIWPEGDIVSLQRFDIYECASPLTQVMISDHKESQRLRKQQDWYIVRSLFTPKSSSVCTREIIIEQADPPKRHRFRPYDKLNHRDLSMWIEKGRFHSLQSQIPGTREYYVDYADSPDRYLISDDISGTISGWRRLYRFLGFPVTQYYILEGECHGNKTCLITSGNAVQVWSDWRYMLRSVSHLSFTCPHR